MFQLLRQIKPDPWKMPLWKVNIGTVIINIIAIYHPPYSDINQSTNAMFLDDLADIFEKHLMSLSNIMVAGDFN